MASITLSQFLAQTPNDEHSQALCAIIADVAQASIAIANSVERGALEGNMGSLATENVQGEVQKTLDVMTNQCLISHLQHNPYVVGLASEEMDEIIQLESKDDDDPAYVVLFDPLDGSSNVNLNISVGTIFSVLPSQTKKPQLADFLQAGNQQVCAGYALYGTSTMLVISIGHGVHGFTLDKANNTFYLTHPNMQIPPQTQEFAVNVSNYRFWQTPVQRYVDECLLGAEGKRGKAFNMRWVASMVAEVHRILMRGGVFMYPSDSKPATQHGKLRLLYEANPMSFLVEQAGGAASTGLIRILEIQPNGLHQRVAVLLGSSDEVARLVSYHQAPHD